MKIKTLLYLPLTLISLPFVIPVLIYHYLKYVEENS